MTVLTPTAKISGSGNGSATVFSFSPIVIFKSSELVVTHVDADGVETLLVEGTGAAKYKVTVATYPGTGSITYPEDAVTPIPTGEKVVMKRILVLEQQTDLENQGGYFADVQEVALDKIVMRLIQQQEEIDRAFRAAIGDVVLTNLEIPPVGPATAGALLGLKSDKSGFEYVSGVGNLPDPVTPVRGGTGQTGIPAANEFLVGDGTKFVRENPATARASMGAGTLSNLKEDLTPQLGGRLDPNAKPIGWAKGANITAADPLVLGADGNYFDVDGNTNFASITVPAGTLFMLQFNGTPTMTHHATNLDLPGEADITVVAGATLIGFATAADQVHVVSYTRADGKAVVSSSSIFTKSFTSSAQTITSAGSLTLAHSLSSQPKQLIAYLTCITGEHNYSAGDELYNFYADIDTNNNEARGLSIVPDATNINIRFGAKTDPLFAAHDKTSGASVALANAKWKLIIFAVA